MTKAEITLTYSDSSAGETENYWLRIMDSDDLKDLITREEAAEFIDTLYDIDPCSVEGTEGGVEPEKDDEGNIVPPVEEEEFADLAKRFLSDTLLCGYDDSSYDAEIIVARSHQQYPYKLVFDNGEYVSTRTVNEEVSFTYVLNKQSSFSLEFPVLSSDNFSFEWNGNVYNERGVVVVNPEYRLDGSTLYFNESLTGSFTCEYETRYDIVTVHVYGEISLNSAYAGQPRPKPEECNVLGFYQGTVTEHTITPPDEDETTSEADMERLCLTGGDINPNPDNISCYEIVTIKTLCRCSGDTADSRDVERSVTCPDRVKYCSGGESTCRHFVGSRTIIEGYTSCPDEEYLEGTVSDPEFYLEKCCEYPSCPPWCPLPPCETIRKVYPGGASFNGDKSNYPPNTQFIAVGPAEGICGTITTNIQVSAKDCCEGAIDLVWDYENSVEILSPDSSGWVHVIGGPKFSTEREWVARGQGLWLDQEFTKKKLVNNSNWKIVYTDETFCGTGIVDVSDYCSDVTGEIRSTEGQWELQCSAPYTKNQDLRDCTMIGPNGGGTFVREITSGRGEFELIEGGWKVIEQVSCLAGVCRGSDICAYGMTICECYHYAFNLHCSGHIWPPGLSTGESWLNSHPYAICSVVGCGYFDTEVPGGRCWICDDLGGMYDPLDSYALTFVHRKILYGRSVYRWVC